MRDRAIRTAILELDKKGHSLRGISLALEVSRKTIRRVLRAGTAEVPVLVREERAEPHEERILRLFLSCRGNLKRVHEELLAGGVDLSYSTLTAFCRRRGIGRFDEPLAGRAARQWFSRPRLSQEAAAAAAAHGFARRLDG